MGSLISSLLHSALLAPKLLCLPKPRSSKYEVHRSLGYAVRRKMVCDIEGGSYCGGWHSFMKVRKPGLCQTTREIGFLSWNHSNMWPCTEKHPCSSLQECVSATVSKSVPEYLSVAVLHKKRARLWERRIQNGIRINCWLSTQKQK